MRVILLLELIEYLMVVLSGKPELNPNSRECNNDDQYAQRYADNGTGPGQSILPSHLMELTTIVGLHGLEKLDNTVYGYEIEHLYTC